MGVKERDSGGNVEMKLEHVDVVSSPGKSFSVGGEDEACEVRYRAVGGVGSGNPLGCGEGEVARLYGDIDVRVVELAGHFGEVGGDADGLLSVESRGNSEGGEYEGTSEHR